MDEMDKGPRQSTSVVSDKTKATLTRALTKAAAASAADQKNVEEMKKPRVLLTEGAIVHKDWLHDSVVKDNDNQGSHQMCSIGDIIMMTDQEFEQHRRGGIALVDQEERDAA